MVEKEESLIKGACFSIFAFFFMAVFGAFFKAANNAPWANFIAFVTGSILLLPYLLKNGFLFLKTEHFLFHFCRAFFGVGASLAYAYAIQFTPLLDATLLYNATPLFIPIFAMWLLKCKTSKHTWIAIAIGFIGVAFIIRPSADILKHTGDLLGLASGILLALAFTFVKILTQTESYLKIVFYYFILATLLQIPFLFFIGSAPQGISLVYCCLAGIALLLGQWGIVKSYSYAPASKVGIFQYSSVVSIGLLDWFIWGVKPTLFEYIGTIIVMSAGVLIISTAHYDSSRNRSS